MTPKNKIPKTKFVSGGHPFFDDERELYYVHVGLDDKDRTLYAAIYGQTKEDAIEGAAAIVLTLNRTFALHRIFS